MNDYISKPIEIERLQLALKEWLHERKKAETGNDNEEIKILGSGETDEDLMDWDHFRMFTDGDIEEEKQLISVFMTYAAESLDILKTAGQKNDAEEWRKAAHKLKGSAANLGAKSLAELCRIAELQFNNTAEQKADHLKNIQRVFDATCTSLADKVGL